VQIEGDVIGGSTLEAFRRLLLLVLLQDDGILQDGPLQPSALRSVEELLLSHPPRNEKDMMLSTVVNLERMLNSGAAEIQGWWCIRQCVCHVASHLVMLMWCFTSSAAACSHNHNCPKHALASPSPRPKNRHPESGCDRAGTKQALTSP
jgi:hypothetical protein